MNDINFIIDENKKLRDENAKLKEHLKKYTAPDRNKKFYENHKTDIIEKNKEYYLTHKPSPEKKKEYNRKWYLKKKEKNKNNENVI